MDSDMFADVCSVHGLLDCTADVGIVPVVPPCRADAGFHPVSAPPVAVSVFWRARHHQASPFDLKDMLVQEQKSRQGLTLGWRGYLVYQRQGG